MAGKPIVFVGRVLLPHWACCLFPIPN
ncbi:hypothetical protein CCACVL1_09909 [Corchorus capsularis]|uniref:Uncharacterized protein n=1 Tax=Corchorus capsularis TaxID=210143 RepID=A0A1R3ITU7_COCAP|nr:hypothetical protein CCACVL1_09909 [Corchorus capsularis]